MHVSVLSLPMQQSEPLVGGSADGTVGRGPDENLLGIKSENLTSELIPFIFSRTNPMAMLFIGM